MNTYKLIENTLNEAATTLLGVTGVKKRFFFQKYNDTCYAIEYHVDYMCSDHINEMNIFLAEREIDSDYFFCKHLTKLVKKLKEDVVKCANRINNETVNLELVSLLDMFTNKPIDVLP